MAGRKLEHLNESIRQKLGRLLYKEANDPRFRSVTITDVKVSKDLSSARVQFCAFNQQADPHDIEAALNAAAGFFSHALGRTMATRRTPKLRFHYDAGFDYAEEIETLLKKVRPLDE